MLSLPITSPVAGLRRRVTDDAVIDLADPAPVSEGQPLMVTGD